MTSSSFSALFLIALCAGLLTRLWLANRHRRHVAAHRDAVPAAFTGSDAEKSAFCGDVMRMFTNRISIFAALPIRSLNRLSLQKHLDEIGKSRL